MRLKLEKKIIGLVLFAAIFPVAIIVLYIVLNYGDTVDRIDRKFELLTRQQLATITRGVHDLCSTTNEIVQTQVDNSLRGARKILDRYGGVKISQETVTWRAINQETKESTTVALPKLRVEGKWLGKNDEPTIPTPYIDEVVGLVGGTATVFQRMNEQGDMLRVATNVIDQQGRRAIGTYIPARTSRGGNPVVSKVLKGAPFRGQAYVVDSWYLTAYQPLRDPGGKVIGMLYVGVKQANLTELRERILQTKVGKSGYVFVIGTKGDQRGRYVISKGGERDGENIWNVRDSRGTEIVKELVETAKQATGHATTFFDYEWKNPKDKRPRRKLAALNFYQPWGWVIGAGVYHDELIPETSRVSRMIQTLIVWALVVGAAIALLAGILAALLGARTTRPFTSLISIANSVAEGDLLAASNSVSELDRSSQIPSFDESESGRMTLDESQQLLMAIKTMTKRLNSLVGQVQRSGIQVNTSSIQISASVKELEAMVSEQASATNEVLATATEISAVAKELEQIVGKVTEVTSQTARFAGTGQEDLEAMESAMRRLADSTRSFSSKLSVINDKTDNVSQVVETISKVADQTNLLSLNAAIEAEKAGEHGRGFSVVAREIRRLADQTGIATQEIAQMSKEMRSAVRAGVMEMDKFAKDVNGIVDEMQRVGSGQGTIIKQVQELKPELDNINEGMSSQAEGAEQIHQAMVKLSEGAQRSMEALEEFTKSTDHLKEANKGLQRETAHFKVISSDQPSAGAG
jgi:methyl-accepting chemotaxis protein WspA